MPLTDQSQLFAHIILVETVVYLGLAFYVISQRPRKSIAWVFAAICLGIANYYVTSLWLFPSSAGSASPSQVPFALRWKWVVNTFSPPLVLHLAWFYFPSPWRRPWRKILAGTYLISAVLALATLFTDLVIVAPVFIPSRLIISYEPGPLAYLFFLLLALALGAGIVGLVAGYRRARSPGLRRQITYLLLPFGLVIVASPALAAFVFIHGRDYYPIEVGHLLLLLTGIFFGRAVLGYGLLVERPLARRRLTYTLLETLAAVCLFALAWFADRWLILRTPLSFPLATILLVIGIAIGYRFVRPRLASLLDRRFFPSERHRQELAERQVQALAELPTPEELQSRLLATLCQTLQVRGGFIAFYEAGNLTRQEAPVLSAHGEQRAHLGKRIPLPELDGPDPCLLADLPSHVADDPLWQEIALVCPLHLDHDERGLVALGEKQGGAPFNEQDLQICAELADRLGAIARMTQLRRQHSRYLETASEHAQALKQLAEEVTTEPPHFLFRSSTAHFGEKEPLAICALGSLEVYRFGERVPDPHWGTEKAKGLLAYLLWRGSEGATREELSRALWPERPAQETANVFHVTLHRLRRVLEPHRQRGSRYIVHERGRYRFNSGAPHALDVRQFQELLSDGSTAALQKAIALYRGAFLQDVAWALPSAAEAQRRLLEESYLDSLRRLAREAGGREAEHYLRHLLVVEPTDEAAQRALVYSYLSRNRRDLARQQVAHWRHALEDLELKPPPQVEALWQRVQEGGEWPGKGSN